MNKKQKKMLVRIILAAVMLVALSFAPVTGLARFVLYLIPYLTVGYDILIKAAKGIKNRQMFDECFLMAIATVGAIALALYERSGDYTEAVAVMLFYQVGEWFQSYAVGRSRRNISELMDIRPDSANVERDGALVNRSTRTSWRSAASSSCSRARRCPSTASCSRAPRLLKHLRPHRREPAARRPSVGRRDPLRLHQHDRSLIKVRTTKEFGESTVSKILDLVENASSRKSKSEDFISKFARVYTPAVCYRRAGAGRPAAAGPPALPRACPRPGATWIYRALTFLVISCPCALVISIPLSFFAGIGGASNAGVLVKGSNYLETLSQTKIVVFDKTGTLTQGVFEVSGIHHNKLEDEKILEYAALVESSSSHPISKSLQRAYGKQIDRSRVSDIQEISGNGVTAKIDGVAVAAGNGKLMDRLGIPYINCHSVGTIIHMAIDGQYAGHIVISDIVKPHAKEAIAALKKAGIHKTVMLTGDTKAVADKVASELGIDEVYSELLPAGKVEKVEELLQAKPEKAKLAFVGDGINDAPVLGRADIGIAMGAMGSDAAIEAADVVLMDDDPMKISKAIRISRKCLRIVYQNIVFAIGIKLLCLLLGALGLANMWLAIFADVGVMVIAVLNAIRALFVKNL